MQPGSAALPDPNAGPNRRIPTSALNGLEPRLLQPTCKPARPSAPLPTRSSLLHPKHPLPHCVQRRPAIQPWDEVMVSHHPATLMPLAPSCAEPWAPTPSPHTSSLVSLASRCADHAPLASHHPPSTAPHLCQLAISFVVMLRTTCEACAMASAATLSSRKMSTTTNRMGHNSVSPDGLPPSCTAAGRQGWRGRRRVSIQGTHGTLHCAPQTWLRRRLARNAQCRRFRVHVLHRHAGSASHVSRHPMLETGVPAAEPTPLWHDSSTTACPCFAGCDPLHTCPIIFVSFSFAHFH